MSKLAIDKIINEIEEALKSSCDGFSVAILCNKALAEILKKEINSKLNINAVLLETCEYKHILKRQINEESCEFLVYEDEFEPIVYEILNDGSTTINHVLNVENLI